jgi:protein-S-isoprenylcysteine O-methyltransferase Ste14
MGRHLVAPAEVRPDTELVTVGAFGTVRHPLYDSVLLLWAGASLALMSIVMSAGFVALIPAFYLRARAEEGLLARHFGDAWTAYAERVPMLLPRLRGR